MDDTEIVTAPALFAALPALSIGFAALPRLPALSIVLVALPALSIVLVALPALPFGVLLADLPLGEPHAEMLTAVISAAKPAFWMFTG